METRGPDTMTPNTYDLCRVVWDAAPIGSLHNLDTMFNAFPPHEQTRYRRCRIASFFAAMGKQKRAKRVHKGVRPQGPHIATWEKLANSASGKGRGYGVDSEPPAGPMVRSRVTPEEAYRSVVAAGGQLVECLNGMAERLRRVNAELREVILMLRKEPK
jgi:hypothetical protein